MSKIQGKSFTSNNAKLLKHLDKLTLLQEGKTPSPVMVHISICNPCNLTCSFCCFANRNMKEMLTIDQITSALTQFRKLGATGVEFTGGGEPTLHPKISESIEIAYNLGFKVGICTNGSKLKNVKNWDMVSWVRLGMYGFDEGYTYDLDLLKKHKVSISAAYVWDGKIETSHNPNSNNVKQSNDNFFRMLDWVEENQIPTRIAFNAIKDPKIVEKDIEVLREILNNKETKYAFLSDFNFKSERRNDNCYMHMVKPFVFTDGNVYVCPSSELSVENNYNMNDQFKLCSIEDIEKFYEQGVTRRTHACKFCKYAMQNELIDDILTETDHNDFA